MRAGAAGGRLWLAGALLAPMMAGCSDALERTTPVGQEIVVLNAQTPSLTLVNAGDFTVSSLALVTAAPGARSVAGQNQSVLVPTGPGDGIQVLTLGGASRTVPLAAGSGATGAAFQDDTLAWVANPGLNTITELNVMTGDTLRSLAVGPRPTAVAVLGGMVFSVNSNTSGDTVQGASTLTAWKTDGSGTPDTIALTGADAHYVVVGDDSLLYVVERGDSGQADGRLSVVDPVSRQEVVVINGLGERPGPGVFHHTGRVLVASRTDGILEVNALTRSVVRGPGAGVKPQGQGVVALALDNRGRIYAVTDGGCAATPGTLYVLSPPPNYDVVASATLGLCPVAAGVAEMPPQ